MQAASTYRADGAAALGCVLDADQLETTREALTNLIPNHGVKGPYASIVHDAWRKAPALAELVPRVGAIACAAAGVPSLVLFHDHLLCKAPGGDDMAWHQEFSYLPLDRADGLTLWIALDDVGVDNGCLYYLPGTHRRGERRAGWGLEGDDDPRASLPPIDVDADEPGIAASMPAGSAIAYDALLYHRSPANQSDRPRRSWQLSFVVPEARWSPRHSPHPRSAVSPRVEGQPLEDDLLRAFDGGPR